MPVLRFFLHLSYDGKQFCGWQVQPKQNSVQGVLEKALSILFKTEIKVIGAGRTDTGVHARSYYAHFDLEESFWNEAVEKNERVLNEIYAKLVYKLNAIVGPNIAIYHLYKVPNDMHARFSAKQRTYHYYFHLNKDPFVLNYSCFIRNSISIDKMNQAAKLLVGKKDFTSFEKVNTQVTTHICDLKEAYIENIGINKYRFVFTADRFLRNMVRSMVGSLLEIGCGKYPNEHINDILEAKDRNSAGVSVPAHGLFLYEVKYF